MQSFKDTSITNMAGLVRIEGLQDDHCICTQPLAKQSPNGPPPSITIEASSSNELASSCRRPRRFTSFTGFTYGLMFVILSALISPATAAFVNFQNCLSTAYQNNVPTSLQFVPQYVAATFNTTDPAYPLTVTVYGNVTGSYLRVTLPAPDDPLWDNASYTNGKIENLTAPYTKYTTLYNKVNVLTYDEWSENVNFCNQLINGTCPLAPIFSNT